MHSRSTRPPRSASPQSVACPRARRVAACQPSPVPWKPSRVSASRSRAAVRDRARGHRAAPSQKKMARAAAHRGPSAPSQYCETRCRSHFERKATQRSGRDSTTGREKSQMGAPPSHSSKSSRGRLPHRRDVEATLVWMAGAKRGLRRAKARPRRVRVTLTVVEVRDVVVGREQEAGSPQ